MKICVVQTNPVKGDIPKNISHHKTLINLAIAHDVDTIIFPELSLTGYEPELAKNLATHQDDYRLDDFQRISDSHKVTIGVGVPIKNSTATNISMVIFQPGKDRQTYHKRYLHPDEEEFFVGAGSTGHIGNEKDIALAICYEISVHEHAEEAFNEGTKIYIASVAKFKSGIDKAIRRLSEIAQKYSMTVLMSNCIGYSDGQECAGKTSIWNNKGELLGQLDDINEGVLIIDTETQELIKEMK